MTKQFRHHAGFTLLELVLVMVIVCVALAMVAPSLAGWNQGSKLRDAGEQLLATIHYARTQSIANGQTYRLNIDTRANTYYLTAQDGQQFVNLANEYGRVFTLPDGFRIDVTAQPAVTQQQAQPGGQQYNASAAAAAAPTNGSAIEFYPTGRTQVAQIRINGYGKDQTILECATPAEGFRVVTAQEAQLR